MSVKLVTSLSPKRLERQRECLDSWRKYDVEILAIQGEPELEHIQSLFPDVRMIGTGSVSRTWSKKTNPNIIEFIRQSEFSDIVIINSDIKLCYPEGVFEKMWGSGPSDRIDCAIRYNLGEKKKFEKCGIDVFRLPQGTHEKFLDIRSFFFIGLPGWDYWLPYTACAMKGMKLATHFHISVEHEEHGDRWNSDDTKKSVALLRRSCRTGVNTVRRWVKSQTRRLGWHSGNLVAMSKKRLDIVRRLGHPVV